MATLASGTHETTANLRSARPCFHLWHPDGGNYTHAHFACWLCGERAVKLTWLGQEFVRNRAARAARRGVTGAECR